MGKRQRDQKDVFESLNSIINTTYNLNNKCLTVLDQLKKADDFNISYRTKEWLENKHEIYAETRDEVNAQNYENITINIDTIKKEIQGLKDKIVEMYAKINPNSTKTFEQLFSSAGIVDEALQKENDENYEILMNNEKIKNEEFWSLVAEYYELEAFSVRYMEFVDMFETIRSLVTYDGYKTWFTGKIPETICEIDENTINELADFVDGLKLNFKGDILKTGAKLNKILKQIEKTPENEELLNRFAELDNEYKTLILFEQTYALLTKNVNVLVERFKSANTTGFSLSNEIFESLVDFGLNVPKEIRKFRDSTKVQTVFAGKCEIVDIIHLIKDFNNSASLMQKLGYIAQATTTIPMENFEESKLIIEELIANTQNSETLAERLEKSKQNAETEKQNNEDNEIKKHLMFETPFGVLWCDGKQLINSKTGEIVDVNRINNTHYNPEKKVFYEIVKDSQKAAETKEQSNGDMQPDGGKSK